VLHHALVDHLKHQAKFAKAAHMDVTVALILLFAPLALPDTS